MALTGKPSRAASAPADVEAFISKGGSVPGAEPQRKGAQHPLKFPEGDLFDRLEAAHKRATVRLPRNTWILQAIAEKLEREESR